MRSKDNDLMQQILNYLNDYYRENCSMPSTAAIGRALGIVKSTVYKYLLAMDERGLLRYRDGVITLEIQQQYSPLSRPSAVYNESISCGPLEGIEATVQEYVQLPTSIFGDDNFIIRTHGDSMIGAGIEEGDLVVIHRQQHANVGDIVVAITETGNTLKRLKYDAETNRYLLHPENPDMKDIAVDNLMIQGVASFIIRKAR